ncbi:MAG TPA: MFS transporter [Stellaceae bacterium]|jgi:MFS family permease|nr:MFS transporter [Stellaceae bacterium]
MEMAYQASQSESAKYPSAGVAWYALICLLLLYFMYFVDRNILTLLVAPVRKDLDINDSQIGLLNGYSFSLLNGLFAIPFGWYADRRTRKNVLIFGITLWGCSTVASGFTTTFTELMLTRMGLGLGEAALAPVAFSLISDYFPKDKRGRAVGIYGIGGFGGIGLSYLIGGAVLAMFRGVNTVDLPVVGTTSLWHAAFIAVGFITLLLALLTSTIREPPRLESTQKVTTGTTEVGFWAHIRTHWQAFWLVIGAYTCLGILAIGWFAWLPSYFIRVFHMPPVQAGIQVGWTTTIAGVTGAVVGGFIADRLMKRGAHGGKVLNLTIMFSCWIVCAIGIWMSDSIAMSLVWTFIFTFADGIGFMQYGNIMQEMFPVHLRARSVAAWGVCSSMFSYGVGPLLFGLSTDFVFHGDDGLRYALGLVSLPIIVIGLACAWFARRPYDRARLAVGSATNIDTAWLEPAGMAVPAKT